MAEKDCEHCMIPDLRIIKRFACNRLALNGDIR